MDILFGTELPPALKIFIAIIVVLGLMGATFYVVRRFGSERLGASAGRGRQPRLAVIDAAAVDGRRRLILIRRDNVEHLLMIGGPTDVVVEPNIVRAAAAPREAAPTRPPPATDTLPRAVPLGEGSMWPLQPEPAPAPLPAAPPRPPRPSVAAEEPMQWHAEPEPPSAPPVPGPRPPRPADPLAGLAAELSRNLPSETTAPNPRPTREREAARQREPLRERDVAHEREVMREPARDREPVRIQQPQPAPSAEAPFASAADQNLAEMAQRLEAALRRPAKRDARPVAPAPRPAPVAEPTTGETEAVAAEASRAAPAAEAPAPESKPVRSEAKSVRDASPAPRKSVYDSLEQEMASLLGRPQNKS
jgi:flagellar protein FliO/FliZ